MDIQNNNYDDIIDMPHHMSASHPQMPLTDRAAQFSPFAALTGHDAAIRETARLTDAKKELDENELELLDEKLLLIQEKMSTHPRVTITYFLPDERKDGGRYVTVSGSVKKIDRVEGRVYLADGTLVPVEDILEIS